MADPRETRKGVAGTGEGVSRLDINACVAWIASVTDVRLQVVPNDGGYIIEGPLCGRVEACFTDGQLALGSNKLFLINFTRSAYDLVRPTSLRYCLAEGWWADFIFGADGNSLRFTGTCFDKPIVPLVVAEQEGEFVLSSPEGLFGKVALRITGEKSESGSFFSVKSEREGTVRNCHCCPANSYARDFHNKRGHNIGENSSRLFIYGLSDARTIYLGTVLRSKVGDEGFSMRTRIGARVCRGDLAPASVLADALFHPGRLMDMVSAEGKEVK